MTEFVDKEKGAKLVKILESGITESRKRPNIMPQKGAPPV